jgi:hypothetical protein
VLAPGVPKTLGRYEIQEELGRGMMGMVYRAIDPVLGRTIALKTVHLAFAVAPGELETFEKRFHAEARAAAGLSHPGIVVVHDVGRDAQAGTLFIALEYLQGQTIASLTDGGKPLEWHEALRITQRIANALHHAHAHGIVHRDIKPANIMILPSGEPKIMDFGIAKLPASQLTTAGEFFGTPSYMSPEQAAGENVDGRSDLFSLGAILYLLLTGRRAFDGPNVPAILSRVSFKNPEPPSRLAPGIPAEVDAVVSRALAKKPADRYPDARSFAEDLEDLVAGCPPRHQVKAPGRLRPEGTVVATAPPTVIAPAVPATREAPTQASLPASTSGTDAGLAAAGQTRSFTGLLLRASDRLGRLGWIILASLVIVGALVAALLRPLLAPLASSVVPPPAQLQIAFEHGLRSGTFKVWVDEDLKVEEDLEGRVTKKVLGYNVRKGSLSETLTVSPEEHVIRVEVSGSDFSKSQRIRGTFESGTTRRLNVSLGTLFKDLNMVWGRTEPSPPE